MMFKMLIGMTFFTVITDIIFSDSAFKKYVNVLIGLFTITVIVQGISGVKELNFDYGFMDEIEKQVNENIYSVNSEIIKNAELNISAVLEKEGIKIKNIEITADESYNIISLKIKLENPELAEKAVFILEQEFDIDKKAVETG